MRSRIHIIEQFAGQRLPIPPNVDLFPADSSPAPGGIGYSQLNEILLTVGYDRISPDFFHFVFGHTDTIRTIDEFTQSIDHFRKLAMLRYGNIKYAFKHLADKDASYISSQFHSCNPIQESTYTRRHSPVLSLETIDARDAYYLGYLVETQLNEQRMTLKAQGQSIQKIEDALAHAESLREIGRRNFTKYLTYDHMDVYIATSMREAHEYYSISQFVKALFETDQLRHLKLRWFDPTQAYCDDRIDKGLVEALMVRRAKCTIYHAQEADTFGKDCELAGTLAQGKPVVAYVPSIDDESQFKSWLKEMMRTVYPGESELIVLKRLCRHYDPKGIWENEKMRGWIFDGKSMELDEAYNLIFRGAKALYDSRAETLQKHHPLSLQVNLDSGVANGVLVVRKVSQCAMLVRGILLRQLEFDIEENERQWLLRERISGSVYRVVTKNELLTNSFWNFYLSSEADI